MFARRSPRVSGAVPLALALAAFGSLSCGSDLNFEFARPEEPEEILLFDLVTGPLDRPSALDVIAGRGRGAPRAVRVDQTGQWDVAFAVIEDEPVWLPRGFFAAFEPSPGITKLGESFDAVFEVPEDRTLYEDVEPVAVEVGRTYAIRSRNDPSLSLPCRLFAKLEVLSLKADPAAIRFRILWNPNCDQRNVTAPPMTE